MLSDKGPLYKSMGRYPFGFPPRQQRRLDQIRKQVLEAYGKEVTDAAEDVADSICANTGAFLSLQVLAPLVLDIADTFLEGTFEKDILEPIRKSRASRQEG
jgi:hypothetical protein